MKSIQFAIMAVLIFGIAASPVFSNELAFAEEEQTTEGHREHAQNERVQEQSDEDQPRESNEDQPRESDKESDKVSDKEETRESDKEESRESDKRQG